MSFHASFALTPNSYTDLIRVKFNIEVLLFKTGPFSVHIKDFGLASSKLRLL